MNTALIKKLNLHQTTVTVAFCSLHYTLYRHSTKVSWLVNTTSDKTGLELETRMLLVSVRPETHSQDHESQQTKITCVAPQGSILGPLLFDTYISPLAQIMENFNILYHTYADDTLLYVTVSSHDYSPLWLLNGWARMLYVFVCLCQAHRTALSLNRAVITDLLIPKSCSLIILPLDIIQIKLIYRFQYSVLTNEENIGHYNQDQTYVINVLLLV